MCVCVCVCQFINRCVCVCLYRYIYIERECPCSHFQKLQISFCGTFYHGNFYCLLSFKEWFDQVFIRVCF